MKREIIITGDGSHSLFVPELNEQYHSVHGALQESRHVFLEMGLRPLEGEHESVDVLEIGFGTGLNALLFAVETRIPLRYTGVEAFPLLMEEAELLNYPDVLGERDLFLRMHAQEPGEFHTLSPLFNLRRLETDIAGLRLGETFDLILFDAFAPEKQPELWTDAVFASMFDMLNTGGLLTTYCAKGVVRRRMVAAGFEVEKLPGPPGKREMLRARRP